MAKSITRFVISWIFGILAVILLVFLVNLSSFFVKTPFIQALVSFVNSNLILLILISFLFFLGSLFFYFGFPINIITPILDAFGAGFLTSLLIGLILVINDYIPIGIGSILRNYSFIISAIVFLLVLVFGFVSVIQSIGKRHRRFEDRRHNEDEEETEEIIEEPSRSEPPKTRRRIVRRRIRKR